MSDDTTAKAQAQEALHAANEGLGGSDEQLENAKLYALVGIGQALLAVEQTLDQVRREIRHAK